jgi:hypothetical protein
MPRCYEVSLNKQVQFCTGGCEDWTWACEAEEPPLLEAVAMERLLKTQQPGNGLAGAVVICEMWRLVVKLLVAQVVSV